MKSIDYIIVGTGLAGMAFIQTLKQNSKSFVVFDDASQQSSSAAAGMYNPVILKRFTKVWKAKEQLTLALPFYSALEAQLNITINYPLQLRRRFTSIEEQNNWLVASDDLATVPFMSSTFLNNDNKHIDAIFGFGEVLSAGRIDTNTLLNAFKDQLAKEQLLIAETFNYNQLKIDNDQLSYDAIKAKHIIFAEGFGVKRNPFFNSVPLNGTKGELLTIHASDLKIDYAIKSSVFVIPIEKDHYLVGSTYNWDDKTNQPTEKAKQELVSKLKTFIKCDFSITDHWAGIRPTVTDRRPLVGQHSQYKSLYILNGLGTRGVMIAPYVAEKLFNFIENGEPLDNEINISRFTS
ncbi:MAG: FAD-dependent oxidoreductase [Winogradskyella sp.]|nr:FAD-dependent oxidoreductase [Winogradskyella sp.]